MEISDYVLPFEACDLTMVNKVGGKCASLGELLKAQIPVLSGYAITTDVYEHFLETNGLATVLDIERCPRYRGSDAG